MDRDRADKSGAQFRRTTIMTNSAKSSGNTASLLARFEVLNRVRTEAVREEEKQKEHRRQLAEANKAKSPRAGLSRRLPVHREEVPKIEVEGVPEGPRGDIALIGLAVMGQNLILNMADHGYVVVAYNRTVSKVERFMANEAKDNKNIIGATSVENMVANLKRPRKVMVMVKAGEAVDAFIDSVLPFLDKGDIIIDGGNSHFPDTIRRTHTLAAAGYNFIGAGISGGEEGARYGPSIMPGGAPDAWPAVKKLFQDISAKVDGEPCCDWVGDDGAGHYVKMVHNGIEYGDIQLICEAYHLLKELVGLNEEQMAKIFAEWNKGELDSYLIEITANILAFKDADGKALVTKIRDTAGQKGTGKWTVVSALDLGIPCTLIGEAVHSRTLSAMKEERGEAATVLTGPSPSIPEDKAKLIDQIKSALYASKIISYAQGFMLLQEAAAVDEWDLNYGSIALMWRGGCIIRSRFLGDIRKAYGTNPKLSNLLLDPFFLKEITRLQDDWRAVVTAGVLNGIPVPAFSAALSFYDGYRNGRLPANLLQAQRDYFGAHTYRRVDKDPNTPFHTNWTGKGGTVASSTYNA